MFVIIKFLTIYGKFNHFFFSFQAIEKVNSIMILSVQCNKPLKYFGRVCNEWIKILSVTTAYRGQL